MPGPTNPKANKAKLFALENTVNDNKVAVYNLRHQIEEQRGLILKNYASIFGANRATADNASVRIMLHHRRTILDLLTPKTPAGEVWVGIMKDEASLASLEHRAKLTTRMAEVNSKMSAINGLLIETNELIMQGNANAVQFNDAQFALNSQLLSGELKPADATDESNAKRIEVNGGRISSLSVEAAEKKQKIDVALENVSKNHVSISKNTAIIYARRDELIAQNKRASEMSQKLVDLSEI